MCVSLVISPELFTTRRNGELKADKAGRGKYMRILAQALREPDEIYARMEWHEAQSKAVVRRRYVTQLLLPDGDETALAVFELGPDGWTGVTTFSPRDMDINDLRVGVRLYRRGGLKAAGRLLRHHRCWLFTMPGTAHRWLTTV